MASDEELYKPKDTIDGAIQGTMVMGTAGAFMSAIQNTLTRKNVGAWGFITRTGSKIALFAAVGGVYELVKLSSANLREKDDALNTAYGGFLAGSIIGMRSGSIPAVLGFGALTAIVMGTFDYTGGRLTGYQRDPNVDIFARKEALRKNRRRPIEETIAEIGEGRGIYAPGYEERRRQRIKEKYGIDVPTNPPATS